MTFVAEVLSLKCLVCPDLRDYIGLCFLCSCRACFFLMLSVFKCGKFSKLLSVHREIQPICHCTVGMNKVIPASYQL